MKKALSIVRPVYTNSENAIGGKARSRFRRECNAVLLIQDLYLDKHLVEHVGIKDILVAIVYDQPGMVCLRCRTITIASR